MVTLLKNFVGNKFKERRLQLGLSMGEVVRICNSSYGKISQHETGTLIKNFNEVHKICTCLCDDGELLAMWIIAYTQLRFPNQQTLDLAIKNIKQATRLIPEKTSE